MRVSCHGSWHFCDLGNFSLAGANVPQSGVPSPKFSIAQGIIFSFGDHLAMQVKQQLLLSGSFFAKLKKTVFNIFYSLVPD
jgi:hypothetical protein